MSGELSAYEQAMLDGVERDYQGLLEAGDEFVDSYLSYFQYAFDHCGEPVREPAVRLLREAAGRRAGEQARQQILAMAAHLETAPAPVRRPPPQPTAAPVPQPAPTGLTFSAMRAGERYRVARTFTDFDGQVLEQGRVLTFSSYTFFPYDGGYTAYFDEGVVRLAEISTGNREVLKALDSYLERLAD